MFPANEWMSWFHDRIPVILASADFEAGHHRFGSPAIGDGARLFALTDAYHAGAKRGAEQRWRSRGARLAQLINELQR